MTALSSSTERKTPRLKRRRVSLAKKPSTALSHEAKLLQLAGLVRISARRIKFALASACPYADEWRLAAARLVTTA